VRFEYDAGGRQVKKITPSMAAGEYLRWTYDASGRMLELDRVIPGSCGAGCPISRVLYKLAWDDGGVAAPTGCGVDLTASASRTLGRTRYRQDSFGYTWFRYDEAGRVIDEIRARNGACTTSPNDNPSTRYTYNANGDLRSIVYPYGRTVQYVYGTGAGAGRVSSVAVTLSNGTTWQTPTTLVSNVQWEPYGGLRSYQVSAGSAQPARLVEYLPGDNAASPGCPASRPSANDATGRLRALWVSSVGGAAAGDILKLTYTWQADRIAATDTCLLGTTTPRTETFTYDGTLRLTGAGRPTGNFAATGGAFSSRSYSYDARGNRTSTVADGIALTPSYAASQVDRLTRLSTGSLYGYTFSYDGDGRVTTKVGPIDSTGLSVSETRYAPGPDPGGANDTVFKSVTVSGAAYNYFYDGLNRRRYKSYPYGTSDGASRSVTQC
jgi:YD repeat-containing protein